MLIVEQQHGLADVSLLQANPAGEARGFVGDAAQRAPRRQRLLREAKKRHERGQRQAGNSKVQEPTLLHCDKWRMPRLLAQRHSKSCGAMPANQPRTASAPVTCDGLWIS